jgi:hypothetical protein
MALHYIYKATQITFNWICTNHHWEKKIWERSTDTTSSLNGTLKESLNSHFELNSTQTLLLTGK